MKGLYRDAVGVEVIRRHTYGLADLGSDGRPDTPVPSCEGWDLADLLWHLYEVQRFWCHVLATRPDGGPESYEEPVRPDGDDRLPEMLRSTCDRLVAALAGADPEERAWSWADDHTVGFTIRRQSHEALIHHVDGVLAVGVDMPDVSVELAADGIDEVVTIMLSGVPDWATFTPGPSRTRLHAADTGDGWTLQLGTFAGTSPNTGNTYEAEPAAELLADDADVSSVVSGPALPLLLWLWGRGDESQLAVDGDAAVLAQLRTLAADATR